MTSTRAKFRRITLLIALMLLVLATSSPQPANASRHSAQVSDSSGLLDGSASAPEVLFSESFDGTPGGDFPSTLNFVNGNMLVVDTLGSKMLKVQSDGSMFAIPLDVDLPQRFTIDFDARIANHQTSIFVTPGPLDDPAGLLFGRAGQIGNYSSAFFAVHSANSGVVQPGGRGSTTPHSPFMQRLVPVKIDVDGSYAKMWIDGMQVANIPNANVRRTGAVRFAFTWYIGPQAPVLIDNIRIAGEVPQELTMLPADVPEYRPMPPLDYEQAARDFDRLLEETRQSTPQDLSDLGVSRDGGTLSERERQVRDATGGLADRIAEAEDAASQRALTMEVNTPYRVGADVMRHSSGLVLIQPEFPDQPDKYNVYIYSGSIDGNWEPYIAIESKTDDYMACMDISFYSHVRGDYVVRIYGYGGIYTENKVRLILLDRWGSRASNLVGEYNIGAWKNIKYPMRIEGGFYQLLLTCKGGFVITDVEIARLSSD